MCAVAAMMSSVLTNGFQFIVSGSQPKALNDFQIVNLQVISALLFCLIDIVSRLLIPWVSWELCNEDTSLPC